MAIRDPGSLPAGVVTLERGMSSGNDPRLIPPNSAPLLVNATVRDGYPTNRPGWRKVALTYERFTFTPSTSGRFQGATLYRPRTGLPLIVASIGGRQFRYNLWGENSVQEISIAGDYNPSNKLQVWFTQAEDFLLMQDGQSAVWSYNGGSSRRLGPREIPVGTIMEYALGRIWVASPDRHSFVAGDLVYSSSGTAAYSYRDAVLKFTENDFLNEGGAFAVPAGAGQINAIRYIPNLDSSLGQGPIEVFTSSGAFSVNAPFDRTTWKDLQYPIQTVSAVCPGAQSQNGTVRVNGDIWYRGLDGIRSFIIARRDFGMWGNVPMSDEMSELLDYDSQNLLQYSSGALFDNRLLMTATPTWNAERGTYHRALAVLDFKLVSSMFQRTQPAWDGMWTGLNILQILSGQTSAGVERCFAFVFNDVTLENEVWELTKTDVFDYDENANPLRIKWGFETRLFDYGNPDGLKSLDTGDVAPADIQGSVDFTFKYRSDENPCWLDWNSFQLCAKDRNCAPTDCLDLKQYQKSYRSRVTLPRPPEVCEVSQAKPSNLGFRNQVRVEITGACSIKQLILRSRALPESPFLGCQSSVATCTEDTCCAMDNYFASVT
ncbi:MAG: hypothetical protein H0U18_17745 [Pyrinomonadaceae bacterium]|nr:hypothetical protein [Pyrinomonadaceae bacterium]